MTGAVVDGSQRFPFKFTGANKAMWLLGMSPRTCFVDVVNGGIVIRFGWPFRCRATLDMIASVTHDHQRVTAWGAHGWRGVWLLNGTSSGILRIDFSARVRGRVLVFPLQIRALRVGVEDPEGLRSALELRDS